MFLSTLKNLTRGTCRPHLRTSLGGIMEISLLARGMQRGRVQSLDLLNRFDCVD